MRKSADARCLTGVSGVRASITSRLRRVRGRGGRGLTRAVSRTVPGLLASRIRRLRRCALLVLREFCGITLRTESQDRGRRRRLGNERAATARLGPAIRQATSFLDGRETSVGGATETLKQTRRWWRACASAAKRLSEMGISRCSPSMIWPFSVEAALRDDARCAAG
jgi:hypothetical protein